MDAALHALEPGHEIGLDDVLASRELVGLQRFGAHAIELRVDGPSRCGRATPPPNETSHEEPRTERARALRRHDVLRDLLA